LNNRVIPSLLLKRNGLVKTVKFKAPKYVGDPINAIRIFNDKEVDELLVLDIDASKLKKEPNYSLIEEFASECFMPLAYGGGITNVEQASRLFNLGVEKVVLQTGALRDLSLISELAELFGSQSIMVSVDLKAKWFGKLSLYHAAERRKLQKPWLEFAQSAVAAGAGEILLNSVDKDGTLSGPDLDSISKASGHLTVPVIAVGGVSSLDDMKAIISAGASAVAAGSFFVFHGPHRAVLITYPSREEIKSVITSTE
jgi:cyclase